MLPLHVAKEIRTSILEYLKATFTFREQRMNKAFIQFLESSNEGIFKGPYISLQLPFEKTSDSSNENTPLDIHPSFPAYLHQQKAFERLSTHNEHPPQPTIVTTGTGSGKTEAFLFPLLDYCYQQRERRGIKAIIMYPMNALATDQAKRIAEEIHKHPKLKGVVTAGLFIGEGKGKMARSREMTQKNIIEDREFILSNPPDILLTNFKMLDYALIKAGYHSIWRHNLHDLQLFKFLVLDELHTYDGAQGSDVANLIRRFKLKIHLADGQLCPVGTSATIGSAEEAPQLLAEYATKIFGEIVEPSAIIGEKRLPIDVFFKSEREQLKDFLPKENALFAASLKRTDDYSIYLTKQLQLWNIEVGVSPLKVSEKLLEYGIFYDLLETCNSNILAVSELIRALSRKNPNYAAYSNDSKEALLESLLCLIGFAKSGEENKAFPFLYLQVQMWLREVRGMLRTVQHSPHFVWNRDKEKTDQPALPMYFCRECGGSGWIGVKEENKEYFERDYAKTYDAYFSNHKNLYFFNTVENELADDYDPTNKIMGHLSNTTLGLYEKKSDNTFPINAVRKLFNSYNAHICPHCNTRNTMALIGTRITTLASVALSQIMSTDMDAQTEKGRKLLAFTNGVQDAAHRAGFFEARNYNFTLRTAIQKVLNLEQSPMNIPQLYKAFVNYWSKQTDESNKNPIEAYYYKFFPKDHIGKITIDNFKDGKEKFQKRFEDEFNRRILWQITSEFGYNARIGRTLEKTGTSATFFKKETLQQVFQKIKAWLRANGIQNIEEKEFVSFLTGFLHRLRMRGGMSHPYSEKFRTEKSNYYLLTQGVNKSYFLMQNFGKKSRLPKYITYKSNPYNVFDLTERNKNLNWYHAYFNKSFPLVMAGNELQLINEFYATLLDYLESEQVLNKRLAIGIPNYALNPKVVCVSTKVEQYDCRVCGHQMTTTQEAEGTMEGMTCLQYRCTGKYQLLDGETATYYQSVYNRDRVIRLYAKDHTGLLERKKRELLEEDFKNRNKHNSTNVMVATSTLEMGIDIGDLNAAVNTSIPPLPSNFLQRIGRAGRKSGTA
ncbi:MAG: DEAD/DEAH box helicase, partial [Chitinophagales bacterium]